jgi:hypothetical protein
MIDLWKTLVIRVKALGSMIVARCEKESEAPMSRKKRP